MASPILSCGTMRVWLLDRDPTSSEVELMDVGNYWLNTSTQELFQCTDNIVDSLQWVKKVSSTGKLPFTPVIIGSTQAGTATYTTQVGRYEKIGNQVFISVNLAWSDHTGTGNMLVSGLPIPPNVESVFTSEVSLQNILLPVGGLTASVRSNAGNLQVVTAITSNAEAAVAMSAGGILRLTMSYMV